MYIYIYISNSLLLIARLCQDTPEQFRNPSRWKELVDETREANSNTAGNIGRWRPKQRASRIPLDNIEKIIRNFWSLGRNPAGLSSATANDFHDSKTCLLFKLISKSHGCSALLCGFESETAASALVKLKVRHDPFPYLLQQEIWHAQSLTVPA